MAADVVAKRIRRRPVEWLPGIALWIVLGVLAVFFLFPFLWVLVTSLRPASSVYAGGLIPDRWTFGAYGAALHNIDLLRHMAISLGVTVATVALVVIVATLAGYGFAHFAFFGRETLFITLLTTMMLPTVVFVIPLFIEMRTLGLINNPVGLVIAYAATGSPLAMFLMRTFFRNLPPELIDAARMDGAGELRIFWSVMRPLAAPGVASLVVFQFMLTWNEFLYANTFIRLPEWLPLQPLLYSLQGSYGTDVPVLCAGIVLSSLPVLIVFAGMQRRFAEGLTLGALNA
ncbi:carbohydrate ABC transporter permease [Dactylosporangium sp. CA-092794]|uniref:carbohydrate ABC transporter permease n=1 Tax=Dactylosporangium sp. CA-092794 TaxID=3239929 RepID=UPI003D907050